MIIIDLEEGLARPPCRKCGAGRIRPLDIDDGEQLQFECPIPKCRWRAYAQLPQLRKTVVYLDTSTVSNMAKALHEKKEGSPWIRLHRVLKDAAAAEVLCCPGSWIVRQEAELSRFADQIVKLSKVFGDPGLKHPLEVREAQLFRALDRYLSEALPSLESEPPRADAFRQPDRWLPVFQILTRFRSSENEITARRTIKSKVRSGVESIYSHYAARGAGFPEIRNAELAAYGRLMVTLGKQALRWRYGMEPIPEGDDPLILLSATTLDLVLKQMIDKCGMTVRDAFVETERFLLSDHVKALPVADINATLHAGLAMLCRGATPRKSQAGDLYDIEHISTYVPYVDIFIVDRFFADLCNRAPMRVGDRYATEIMNLNADTVDSFIERINDLVAHAPEAALAARISKAIAEGGFHEEFDKLARAFLKSRAIAPDD